MTVVCTSSCDQQLEAKRIPATLFPRALPFSNITYEDRIRGHSPAWYATSDISFQPLTSRVDPRYFAAISKDVCCVGKFSDKDHFKSRNFNLRPNYFCKEAW